MNIEAAGGSRSLNSLTSLITATLVCVVLARSRGVAAWLLQLRGAVSVAAGALALATADPARSSCTGA